MNGRNAARSFAIRWHHGARLTELLNPAGPE
jgi:hypothetical protein